MIVQGQDISSQWWRVCNLYTIRNKSGVLVPFVPNHEQTLFYRARHTCNHIGKARQLGFSTLMKILALDAMLFPSGDSIVPPSPDGLSVGHIDFSLPDAKKKLRIVREAYSYMDSPRLHPDTWKIGRGIKLAIKMRFAAESIVFSNGSSIWIGTSLRGSTPQILDISELGKIAFFFPLKAEEIRSGALNAIAPGNLVNIESTHEGGEAGMHYDLLNTAMEQDPQEMTAIDFKFHFFPWYHSPEYTLNSSAKIRPEIEAYFARISQKIDYEFSYGQKLWYDRKQKSQGYAMKKEFPTTPGEMFEAINQYAIYGTEMADLVAAHPPRICDFGCDATLPIYSFWDIGMSDYTAVWLIQPHGRFFLVLDWYENNGVSAGYHAEKMRAWEGKWKKTIAAHYLPHDSNTLAIGSGKSFRNELETAGIYNIKIVPRTPDKWLGIGYVRDVLPHCYFHKTNCDTPRDVEGKKLPSGVSALKGYHKDITPAGKTLREMPKHDLFSHSADAFRTFAEAFRRGMIDTSEIRHIPKATGGPKFRGRR